MNQETVVLPNNILFSGYTGEYVFEQIKLGNFYESELLEKWANDLSENSVVFDIGANLGNHTVYFSRINNVRKVYSFEPVKKNYELLQKNCVDNGCTQAKLFNIGLGEHSSRASMSDDETNFGAIELNESVNGEIEICAIDELGLEKPDFIKIDVEGFEVKVLKGMFGLLQKVQPTIWIEVRPETCLEVHQFLEKFGYFLVSMHNFNLLYKADKQYDNKLIREQLLFNNMKNLHAAWEYKKTSMKYNSAFLYEQKKVNDLNGLCKKKESQFLYEQKKAQTLAHDLDVKTTELRSSAEKINELKGEIAELKKQSQQQQLAYQQEQKKCGSLEKELQLYKSSKPYKMQHKIWKTKSKTRFYLKKYAYKLAYRVYRVIEPYPKLVKLAYKVNDKLQIVKNKDEARQIYNASKKNKSWQRNLEKIKPIKELKIAAILDEFSYNCFKYECNLLPLEPDTWLEVFEKEKPDLFFCESAWSGANSARRPWKGKIYSSINFPKENRAVLLSILDYCKDHGIPTVFWNKEDPSHYEDKVHNFVDTAIKFDHVFTTAEECVDRYKKEYGHNSVHSLMFATQPKMFNPTEKYERTDEVIFAGSWYSYHEQRCKEMEEIFDKILASGKQLVIYNRYYGDSDPNHIFPKKYEPYIRPALPFAEIDKAYKGSQLALNITTVTESETMFARRVFELASCNTAILSNYSVGIEKVFGNNIIFTDRDLDFSNLAEKKAANLDNVLTYHTYEKRLEQVLDTIGFSYLPKDKSVSVYYTIKSFDDLEKMLKNFQQNIYMDKHLKIIYDDADMDLALLRQLEAMGVEFYCKSYLEQYDKDVEDTSAYIAFADETMREDFIEKAIKHFCYLDDNMCVVQKENGCEIEVENNGIKMNSLRRKRNNN